MDFNKLKSILLSDDPIASIRAKEKEIMKYIPELQVCKGFNQNTPWHYLDVWEHTLQVVGGVSSKLELRLSALFHDIGKPRHYVVDDAGIGHFNKHWESSTEIFLNFARQEHLDDELTKFVSNLIFYHDYSNPDYQACYKKLSKVFTKRDMSILYELKRSDLLAHSKSKHYLLKGLIEYEKQITKLFKE